jgi:uroporphyrin-III C-methyltransferase
MSDPVAIETAASAPATEPVVDRSTRTLPLLTIFLIAVSLISIGASVSLWGKLNNIQEALARQSADATATSVEAKTLAKSAQDVAKEINSRQAVLESRLSEVALQRGQLEDLMQSLSRSRDDNLVVDLDSALRLSQQQANLTGSLEPLLAALRSAEQRVARSAQPRLASLQRALIKDLERVKTANVADTPSLLLKFDELVRLVDELPLANAVAAPSKSSAGVKEAKSPLRQSTPDATAKEGTGLAASWPQWLKTWVNSVRDETRSLVRVSRIDTPEAALLTPEQSFFARENLKLTLLNARLALVSRQFDASRKDLTTASGLLTRYFDGSARALPQAQGLLQQLQQQLKAAEQPRIDDTLNALTTLSATAVAPGK